jgi:hypothetical protein
LHRQINSGLPIISIGYLGIASKTRVAASHLRALIAALASSIQAIVSVAPFVRVGENAELQGGPLVIRVDWH